MAQDPDPAEGGDAVQASEAISQPLSSQSCSAGCRGSASAAFLKSSWPALMARTQISVERVRRGDISFVTRILRDS